jgi:hypothetical protein
LYNTLGTYNEVRGVYEHWLAKRAKSIPLPTTC